MSSQLSTLVTRPPQVDEKAQVSFPVSSHAFHLIQTRANGIRDYNVLGGVTNVYKQGLETLVSSHSKKTIFKPSFQKRIGAKNCALPYDASIYNASALSFGPLSKNFILALNKAASLQSFYQNTGEAGLSPYHLGFDINLEQNGFDIEHYFEQLSTIEPIDWANSGDAVWEIGTGYFGCRNSDGDFDRELFKRRACLPKVKMIELKLSQGTEPSRAIPMTSVPLSVYKVLAVEKGQKIYLPDTHQAFSTQVELLRFIKELRALSGGKPVGIKISLGLRSKFLSFCKAILKTGITPDFITIDGLEGGSVISSKGASGFVGTPLDDAIVYIHNALTAIGVREDITLIASGKVFSEQDIICKLARGADICATARAMIVAAGCDQQQECNKGTCLKGIATQNENLNSLLDIETTAQKIAQFHKITLQELSDILSAAGFSSPEEITPEHLQKRIAPTELKPLSQLYEFVKPKSLLRRFSWNVPQYFKSDWEQASPYALI